MCKRLQGYPYRFSLVFLTVLFIVSAEITLQGQVPTSSLIADVGAPFSLRATNGNKIVSDSAGTLHAVYADQGIIKYTKSSDGVTWSTPVSISPSGSTQPTIAATKSFVGVAYVKSSGIGLFYTFKPLIGDWSPRVLIDNIEEKDPSIVSYGASMHLTWAGGSAINYVSFPANLTASPQNVEHFINFTTLCGTWFADEPSIAVTQTSATDLTPLVRVSFFSSMASCPLSSVPNLFGLTVSQRPSVPSFGPWPEVFTTLNSYANLFQTGRVSNSMCVDPTTGDFYNGYSFLVNGIGHTGLIYQNAWNGSQWREVEILPRRSLIHVATAQNSQTCPRRPLFRIAVSDFTTGANGSYGPTWVRTGQWLGAASAPIYRGGMITLSNNARDPQAVFWEHHFGSFIVGFTRYITAIYEEETGSSHRVKEDTTTANGRQNFAACLSPFRGTPSSTP